MEESLAIGLGVLGREARFLDLLVVLRDEEESLNDEEEEGESSQADRTREPMNDLFCLR